MEPFRVCHVTSEIAPYAKTGGLADVSAALPEYQVRAGHDARVITPLYASMDVESAGLRTSADVDEIAVPVGERTYACSVYETRTTGAKVPVYFVHSPRLYDRDALYTSDPDEHVRFIVLQRAAIEICQRLGWSPHVFHCHDWQTALLPLYLKTLYAWDALFRNSRSVLTIHNLGYQGIFPARAVEDAGLTPVRRHLHREELERGRVGFLRTGILYADLLTTVSPTYAREIQTPELGLGLDRLLARRRESLVGILNGVDTAVWNPRTDRHLEYRYSARSLWRKAKNKEALLAELGLDPAGDAPVIGMVTRLTYQKGIDLLVEPLPALLRERDVRLAVLASGEPDHERFLTELQQRFPGKVSFWRGFHERLAHRIEAGADLFLMPSLYEPCGLNQMYSRMYGTVPIVRNTGGLADTVELWDPDTEEGSGIVFDHPTPDGVRWALEAALHLFADRTAWKKLVRNTMDCDFSWERQIDRYVDAYDHVVRRDRVEVSA
jgi:starch synthase